MSLAISAFAPEPLFTRRAYRKNMARAAKAFSAISLGAAFVLTTGEAGAQSSRASAEEGFSPLNGTPIGFNDAGDLIVLMADGSEAIIPRGEYGLIGDQIMVSDMIEGVEVAQNGYIPPTSGVPVYGSPGPLGMGYASWLIPLGLVAAGVLAYIYFSRSVNTAPELSQATYTADFKENATGTVLTVAATDEEADSIAYSITGTDSAYFSIDPASGAITFKSSPNEESQSDSGLDNVYNFTVNATDDHGSTSSSTVTVTVLDDDTDYVTDADDDLSNNLGTGNDDVEATATDIQSFDALAGNDAVKLTGTATMLDGTTGDMGPGHDHLTIESLAVAAAQSATFDLDSGDDWFQLDAVLGGTLTVDLGTGADIVDIDTETPGNAAQLIIEALGTDDLIDLRGLGLAQGVNTTVYGSLALAMAELDEADVVFWDNGADLQMIIDADTDDDTAAAGDADGGDMWVDLIGIQSVTSAMFDLT